MPPIAVYCCVFCWGAVQHCHCQFKSNFTNQKVIKNMACWSKSMPFPPPTDIIRPHILVDCCVISFLALIQVGVEVIPSEPSRIDTPRCANKLIMKIALEGPNPCHYPPVLALFAAHTHPKATCKWSMDRSNGKLINRMEIGQKSHIFYSPSNMKIGPPGSN